MKKNILSASLFLLLAAVVAQASGVVNYIDSADFMKYLKEKKSVYMVDIQKKNDYLRHHFYGALPTYAYPVRSGHDRAALAAVVAELKKTDDPVVIIGPRGRRASQRAYSFLLQQGIDSRRLSVLRKGIRGWPRPEILLNTYGQ